MSQARYAGAIRDPIHGYIPLTALELEVLGCREVQRLRHIAQLGLTEWVYPGARHSRFEHALGTLHVASRVFEELRGRIGIRGCLSVLGLKCTDAEYERLTETARCVALLHDLGHAPFSHVTEELLPDASVLAADAVVNHDPESAVTTHESLTVALVQRQGDSTSVGEPLRERGGGLFDDVLSILRSLAGHPPSLPAHLAFVANVIAGPIGADRMDYLLRDSGATGVNYGLFDLDRVLHTVVPIAIPERGTSSVASAAVELGVERGGAMAVEGLWAGRESMFDQVYRHHTRRILDRHLVDFLKQTLPGGKYPRDLDEYLQWSDPRVWEALRIADRDSKQAGHELAAQILRRRHHRLLPQEVHAESPDRLVELLEGWSQRIRQVVADADPQYDVLADTRDGEGVWCLEPTGSVSRIEPRLALQRARGGGTSLYRGRMYVRRQALGIPNIEGSQG